MHAGVNFQGATSPGGRLPAAPRDMRKSCGLLRVCACPARLLGAAEGFYPRRSHLNSEENDSAALFFLTRNRELAAAGLGWFSGRARPLPARAPCRPARAATHVAVSIAIDPFGIKNENAAGIDDPAESLDLLLWCLFSRTHFNVTFLCLRLLFNVFPYSCFVYSRL